MENIIPRLALLSLVVVTVSQPWQHLTMAFQSPTNVGFSRQQHVKRTHETTFFMEMGTTSNAIAEDSMKQSYWQQQQQRQRQRQQQALPKSMIPLSTQQLSMVSACWAACSTAMSTSFLSRLVVPLDSFFSQHTSVLSHYCGSGSENFWSSSISEVLNKSHLAMDIVTLLCGPSMMSARLACVAGRMLGLMADYLPGQEQQAVMAPDEWLFQVLMLYLAFAGLFKAASHSVVSQFVSHPVEHQDMRAYSTFFKPAGMQWHQYKALLVFAMEWVTIPEGASISSSEDYTYILYKGRVSAGENTSTMMASKSATQKLGAISFLQQLENRSDGAMYPSSLLEMLCQGSEEDECSLVDFEDDASDETWKAIGGTVTFLRINVKAAMSLIQDYDETLESPLRNIMLRGIKAKLQHISSSR